MNITHRSCLLLTVFSLLLIGCGGNASSNSSNQETLDEKVTIYLPLDEIEGQEGFKRISKIEPIIKNKASKLVKEDAEGQNTLNWNIYDKKPNGAEIINEYDSFRQSQVIRFEGDGLNNAYSIGFISTSGAWKNTTHTLLQWSMKYDESFYIYARLSTPKGYRYLYYTASDYSYGMIKSYDSPHYIHHGLGVDAKNGNWQTFTRDLEADLKEFEPDNTISSVDGFLIRGSGSIDDINLFENNPKTVAEKSVDQWLKEKKYTLNNSLIVDDIEQRAIAYVQNNKTKSNEIIIFDTSNPNRLKVLTQEIFSKYDYLLEIKTIDKETILVASSLTLRLYNRNSADLINKIPLEGVENSGAKYLKITGNYAIYSRVNTPIIEEQGLESLKLPSILRRVDFTYRDDEVLEILYIAVDNNTNYVLSEDGSKVLVKNEDEEVIHEVEL